ncbi:MAG: hypothetical protein ACLUOI_17040 [Eisenbergiella sp.]
MNRTYMSGGMIYDGTGRDPFCGDIVIKDTKIEEVLPHRTDRFTGTEGPLIHAEGLAVTPGFVDVHRHCDFSVQTLLGIGTKTRDNHSAWETRQALPSDDSSRAAVSRFWNPASESLRTEAFRIFLPERIACEEAAAA